MPLDHLHDRADMQRAQRAQRRLRTFAGLLAVFALVVVVLQYTPYGLLPERTTYTLWGVLVGIVGMALLIDRRWAAAARRDRVG